MTSLCFNLFRAGHSVTMITYVMEVAYLSDRKEGRKIRAAYDSLFSFQTNESVTELQIRLVCPAFELLIVNLKSSF